MGLSVRRTRRNKITSKKTLGIRYHAKRTRKVIVKRSKWTHWTDKQLKESASLRAQGFTWREVATRLKKPNKFSSLQSKFRKSKYYSPSIIEKSKKTAKKPYTFPEPNTTTKLDSFGAYLRTQMVGSSMKLSINYETKA